MAVWGNRIEIGLYVTTHSCVYISLNVLYHPIVLQCHSEGLYLDDVLRADDEVAALYLNR